MKDFGFSTVFAYNGFHMPGVRKTHDIEGNHEERFLKAFDEFNDALFRHAFLRVSNREKAIDGGKKGSCKSSYKKIFSNTF